MDDDVQRAIARVAARCAERNRTFDVLERLLADLTKDLDALRRRIEDLERR